MRITELRTKNMSKRALAEAAGISYSYLWRLEAARQDPTLTVLEKIARALKVPIERLLKRPSWTASSCAATAVLLREQRTDRIAGLADSVRPGRMRLEMATTNYEVSLFIQVPDEGETEAWQVEQALRDAAEEHLWQVVSLTVTSAENP